MFPRDRRLRRRRDIARLLRQGRSVSLPSLHLRLYRTPLAQPRATVVVGSKVSKRATVRNRLKRQLRAELSAALRSVTGGLDLMLTVRPPFLAATTAQRRAALAELFRRARLS
jgi:ribonuclease P protein component